MVWIYYSLPIHSSADGYSGCLQFMIIINKAVTSIHIQGRMSTYVSYFLE